MVTVLAYRRSGATQGAAGFGQVMRGLGRFALQSRSAIGHR
jgi:hypothetical protein